MITVIIDFERLLIRELLYHLLLSELLLCQDFLERGRLVLGVGALFSGRVANVKFVFQFALTSFYGALRRIISIFVRIGEIAATIDLF